MVTAIVQARIGSTRLPNKMLLDLHGLKIIEWVLLRLSKSKKIDKFVVAIPDTPENKLLEKYILKYNYTVFKGSESDVLDRFYKAAIQNKGNYLIRVCADNPLLSSSEIDRLIDVFLDNNLNYMYNNVPKRNLYPDGLGAEMVDFDTLTHIYDNAKLANHREHIFNYIWDNPEKFNIGTFDPHDDDLKHPELKLDIDTLNDYDWLKLLPINVNMVTKEIIKIAVLYKNRKESLK